MGNTRSLNASVVIRHRWRLLPLVLGLVCAGPPGVVAADAGRPQVGPRFSFGVFGNQRRDEDQRSRFRDLVTSINATDLAFSVDDGGIGAAPDDCSDDYELDTRELFDRFRAPLVYTPGQSDWRECVGGDGPLARLGALRRIFFGADRPVLPREHQRPYYPENSRWTYGSVTFATVHAIAEGDGPGESRDGDTDVAPRRAAAVAWLNQTFDDAQRRGSAGVVIVWQADPHFGQRGTAYDGLRGALRARTISFGRPVVLVHGDSGYFRIDKPMVDDGGKRVENFTRVETFAGPEVDWVRGIVDPADPGLFTFRPEIVPESTTAERR